MGELNSNAINDYTFDVLHAMLKSLGITDTTFTRDNICKGDKYVKCDTMGAETVLYLTIEVPEKQGKDGFTILPSEENIPKGENQRFQVVKLTILDPHGAVEDTLDLLFSKIFFPLYPMEFYFDSTGITGGIPNKAYGNIVEQLTSLKVHGGLSEDTTQTYKVVKILDLSRSKLTEFTASKFPEVTLLNLSSNELRTIVFEEPKFETLDLSSNQLQSLPDLPASLKTLNLSSNSLESLPTLPQSLNLKEVNVSHNRITGKFPTALLGTKTTTLDISHNAITDFPDVLSQSPLLEVLHVNDNNHLNGEISIQSDSALRDVDVSGTEVQLRISPQWFSSTMSKLVAPHVTVSFTDAKDESSEEGSGEEASWENGYALPETISSDVVVLDLSHAELKGKLPDWPASSLTHLTTLKLDGNDLRGCPPDSWYQHPILYEAVNALQESDGLFQSCEPPKPNPPGGEESGSGHTDPTTTTTTTTTIAPSSSSSSLSGGAIAGIAVGCGIGVLLLVALIVFCCCRRRRQKPSSHNGSEGSPRTTILYAEDRRPRQHSLTDKYATREDVNEGVVEGEGDETTEVSFSSGEESSAESGSTTDAQARSYPDMPSEEIKERKERLEASFSDIPYVEE